MNVEIVRDLLARIRKIKVAVYGDFFIDARLTFDPRGSETSAETGLKAFAVATQDYALGGAGNVASNLAALEPAQIAAIGVVGHDVFGREILRQLDALRVDTGRIVVQKESFDTMTCCKQYLDQDERARIDFGVFNKWTEETERKLLDGLREAFTTADVIVLSQQVPGSIPNESFIRAVNALIEEFPGKIVVLDSRHYGDKFRNVYRKINQKELVFLGKGGAESGEMLGLVELKRLVKKVYKRSGKTVFVTRGQRGLLAYDSEGQHEVPGIDISGRLDSFGAGDTVLSALACCLAAGTGADDAAHFAGFAAGVTVQKVFQTGTASGSEILAIARDADFVFQPELADDISMARCLPDSEVEICCDPRFLPKGSIAHAVFDNDGTISVLRHGWDAVMERMMVHAILGPRLHSAPEALRNRVANRVREYISQSAGLQTIRQMETLVEMIGEFGIVAAEKILDKTVYRDIYYKTLMEQAAARMGKLRRGELAPDDFMIKGSLQFMKKLREMGITLYLASGANSEDVVEESGVMGYSELFNGGIYGASGELSMHPKKIVIETIMRDNNLAGSELVCFGDGPVEMRECRRSGGTSIGVATDEVVRYGLNPGKRSRLIKAGAHMIIPDFSQGDTLIKLLFKTKQVKGDRKI